MVLAINFEALHRVFYMRIECNSWYINTSSYNRKRKSKHPGCLKIRLYLTLSFVFAVSNNLAWSWNMVRCAPIYSNYSDLRKMTLLGVQISFYISFLCLHSCSLCLWPDKVVVSNIHKNVSWLVPLKNIQQKYTCGYFCLGFNWLNQTKNKNHASTTHYVQSKHFRYQIEDVQSEQLVNELQTKVGKELILSLA